MKIVREGLIRPAAVCALLVVSMSVCPVVFAQTADCSHADGQSAGVQIRQDAGSNQLVARLGDMTEWSLVVQSGTAMASPAVSDDQQKLAYLAEEFGRWRAFLQRLETGYRVEVALFIEKPSRLCFSGDGESLVVVGADGQGNVISIKNAWSSLN